MHIITLICLIVAPGELRLHLEERRCHQVVHPVVVHHEAERGRQAIERAEEPTNVTQVVQEVVDNSTNRHPVLVEVEGDAARDRCEVIICVR